MKLGLYAHLFIALNMTALCAQEHPSLMPLREEVIFQRCNQVMARNAVPEQHSLFVEIRNQSMDATQACMYLYDLATLNGGVMSSSNYGSMVNPGNPIARAVLLNFFLTFNSWERAPFIKEKAHISNFAWDERINEHSALALHLTRAAFVPNTPFRDVVTGNFSLRSRRDINTRNNPIFTQTGNFLGVRLRETTPFNANGNPVNYNFPYQLHMGGGGVIGDQSWLVAHLELSRSADGGLKMHRDLAQHLLEQTLCLTPPYIQLQDTTQLVNEYNQHLQATNAPSIPFRRDGICMSCHATMDGLAAGFRNIKIRSYDSAIMANFEGKPVNHLTFETVNRPLSQPVHHFAAHNPTYDREPPTFRIFFRSFLSPYSLVDFSLTAEEVGNASAAISRIGNFIANRPEFYTCTAKRVVERFTGIEIMLRKSPPLSNEPIDDQIYFNFVKNLGANFQNHQNFRTLVRDVIASDLFRSSGLRLEKEVSP